ncbi:MAG: NTP transferase domain-containing protein [Candidatus Aenigmarchaeota archaeon]|nr:NTP transferase domain-containing protein [Candidatus Aenigmarchaeota archaeon]
MKGVILAGGTAMRLRPLTLVTNKHLLPIYNKPMIFYPIETLKDAGIKDILVITGKEHAGAVFSLLGSGKEMGVNFTFKVQDEPSGIPSAIGIAEDFVGGDKFVAINGDNILTHPITRFVKEFEQGSEDARILLYKGTPEQAMKSGVAVLNGDRVVQLIEKPKSPPSTMISIGVNMYSPEAFGAIKQLKPSPRGETEITELNGYFLRKGTLKASVIDGHWLDAGTIEELMEANIKLKELKNSGK